MSQHFFRTATAAGIPVEVMLGWDRPLGRFFMVVETTEQAASETDNILYSNLTDPEDAALDLAYFRNKLKALGINGPESMFVEAELDGRTNAGNRRILHRGDGRFEPM